MNRATADLQCAYESGVPITAWQPASRRKADFFGVVCSGIFAAFTQHRCANTIRKQLTECVRTRSDAKLVSRASVVPRRPNQTERDHKHHYATLDSRAVQFCRRGRADLRAALIIARFRNDEHVRLYVQSSNRFLCQLRWFLVPWCVIVGCTSGFNRTSTAHWPSARSGHSLQFCELSRRFASLLGRLAM